MHLPSREKTEGPTNRVPKETGHKMRKSGWQQTSPIRDGLCFCCWYLSSNPVQQDRELGHAHPLASLGRISALTEHHDVSVLLRPEV